MAGGTFTLSGMKERPGTYMNFKSGRSTILGAGNNGAVLMPLIGADWGPAGEFIEISAASPDANFVKLGHSVYDDTPLMLLIRECLKGCGKVFTFIPTAGTKATATIDSKLVCTAKYGGTLGNKLKVTIVANADLGNGYFNVIVTLDDTTVETHVGAQTIGDLAGVSEYIVFTAATGSTASTALVANAGTSLTGGADGSMNNSDFTTQLDRSETLDIKVIAFPYSSTTYSALCAGIKSKIKYFREQAGKRVQAVMANYASDYEGGLNVTNSYALNGVELTTEQAVAFVAGITAGASKTQSNTYRTVDGAIAVVNPKTHDQAVAAIKAGEIFFSYDNNYNVVVEYDINSLVTIADGKGEDYKKNRIIRTMDDFYNTVMNNFPPNKFNNDETGWEIMEGIGKGILRNFLDDGAITNVDFDNDFKVDKSRSVGDQTYFNVGLQIVDSAEKLYFTVTTY